MIFCDEEYPKILDDIAQFLEAKNIELVFVNDDEIRKINKQQRGIDKATDVLSFPFLNDGSQQALLGSLVISTDTSRRVASELAHSYEAEIALLFTHGVLHILGFDHETDSGEMREKEKEVVEHFNLPQSLIVRNS